MPEIFEITYEAEPVGKARIEKQGLYYRFSCRCKLPDDGFYRVNVCYGTDHVDLGICVPMEELFGMDKKIPLRQIPEGTPSFLLRSNDWKPEEKVIEEADAELQMPMPTVGTFVPVAEDEPFEHLDELEGAVLETRDGEVGILLQNEQ